MKYLAYILLTMSFIIACDAYHSGPDPLPGDPPAAADEVVKIKYWKRLRPYRCVRIGKRLCARRVGRKVFLYKTRWGCYRIFKLCKVKQGKDCWLGKWQYVLVRNGRKYVLQGIKYR